MWKFRYRHLEDYRDSLHGRWRLEWTCVRPHMLPKFASAFELIVTCSNVDISLMTTSNGFGAMPSSTSQTTCLKREYISRAQISNQSRRSVSESSMRINNFFVGARRHISGLRSTTLPLSRGRLLPTPCLCTASHHNNVDGCICAWRSDHTPR
jgi:hypothetical protein